MRPSRAMLARIMAAAAALIALVVVGRLSAGSLRPSSLPTVTTVHLPDVTRPRPTTPSPVTAHLRLGQITAVVVDGDVVWAAHGCAISRVDAHTGRVMAMVTGLRPTSVGCFVVGMAAGAGALWATLSGEELLRIDPASNRVVATLAMADPVASPVVTAGGVWLACCWNGIVASRSAGWLIRVDPASMRLAGRLRLPGLPTAVGVGTSGLWVTGAGGPIWRVDPASGRVVATIPVPGGLGGLPRKGPAGQAGEVLVRPDAVWVSDPASAKVLRIDPAHNRLAGAEPADGVPLVAAGGAVWAANGTSLLALGDHDHKVSFGEFVEQEQEGGRPISDLAATPGAVWVGTAAGLFRVDLARLQ